jgi:hypothetical protein
VGRFFVSRREKSIRNIKAKKGEHKNGKRLQKHTEYADNVV